MIPKGRNGVTTLKKLYESIVRNPTSVRFEELDKLLRRAGFEVSQPGGGSSHYIYRKGGQRLVVPYNRPFLKSVYVKKAITLLEGLGSEGDDSGD